jgi:hypothetical protein
MDQEMNGGMDDGMDGMDPGMDMDDGMNEQSPE